MSLTEQRARRGGHEAGAVAVELAVILPFLTILVVGAIDVGLVTMEHQILQNAAREGARYAAMPFNDLTDPSGPMKLEQIQQRVVDYLADEGITVVLDDVTVQQGDGACEVTYGDGTTVGCSRVIVDYEKSLLMPGLNLLGVDPVPLQGQAVFRNLFGN